MVRECLLWIAELSRSSLKDRKKVISQVHEKLISLKRGKVTKEGSEFVSNLENNCTLIGFCPNIIHIKPKSTKQNHDTSFMHVFDKETTLYKINDLPALIVTNHSINLKDFKQNKIKLSENDEDRFKVRWANQISSASTKDRANTISLIKHGIHCYKNGEPNFIGKRLNTFLKNKCTLIGFCPKIMYVTGRRGNKQDLNAMYVHTFGQKTLVYKIDDLPAFIVTNGSIELDDTVLRRIKGNEDIEEIKSLEGITG